jgi:hypothetical protein
MKHPLARGCAGAALLAMSGFASAQTSPPPAGIAQQNDQNAKSSADGNTASPAMPGAPQSSNEVLQEIIVTATPSVGGLKRLDAAFSEVSLSQEQIKEANLTAGADLLKWSPGVYVESSGGSGAGANVEVAGFPSFSLSPYVTYQLNGASLFPMAGQVFLEGTSLLRPDDTLQRVEMVQGGGPGVLYGDGQVGLTANYILRRGTDTPAGDFGFTYGSEGAERIDGFFGGPINKDAGLYGSIGGYWDRSDGVRDPQFTADQGGQFTATVSKDWANGSLLVYGRYEDFDDQFVTDTPFSYAGNGAWNASPYFNPLTGTESSRADQYLSLPVAPCVTAGCTTPSTIALNQANGRGIELSVVGGEFNWDFGHGVQVLDDFSVSNGVAHMDALYSSGLTPSPQTLQTFLTGHTPASLSGTTASAYYTSTGAAVPLSEEVLEAETRFLSERYHSISNELHASWEIFPGNTLTVGNRTVFYRIRETYYTGADILIQAQSNPTPIGINLTNGTGTYQLASPQGFLNGPGGTNNGANYDNGTGNNVAFFLSDSWKIGGFLFDAGVRDERQQFNYTAENSATVNYTTDPYLLWAHGGTLTPGSTAFDYDRTAPSWTVGLNYEFNPVFSAYVRTNHGVHFLAFSDIQGLPQGNPGPNQTAQNYEVGVKFKNEYIFADVSVFHRTFKNVPVEITSVPDPTPTNPNATANATLVYGSKTTGVEYQLTFRPFHGMNALDGFSLSAQGDYARGTYDDTDGCVSLNGGPPKCTPADNFTGYLLDRQPTFQTRVTPAYDTDTSWGRIKVWANVEYVGTHYGDQIEKQPLGTYYDLAAGVTGLVGQHWEWTVSGTNLTNQIGMTESNPRGTLFGAIAPGPQLGRSIDGREASLQLKFKF